MILTTEPSVVCRLGREPIYVGRARQFARKALSQWDRGEHIDLVELIVSELITNAIRHGEGPIAMRLSCIDGALRIDAHDGGAGRPVRQHAVVHDESGRGLELVDGLIKLHGGERGVINDKVGPGKTVYVLISLASGPADAHDCTGPDFS